MNSSYGDFPTACRCRSRASPRRQRLCLDRRPITMSTVRSRVLAAGLGLVAGGLIGVAVAVKERPQPLTCLTPAPRPPGGPCSHSPINWATVVPVGVATAVAVYVLARLLAWGFRRQ